MSMPQEQWLDAADTAISHDRELRARTLLYAMAIVVAALLFWASWAQLDEVTRGQATVIPSSQRQLIQSLDGGLITRIQVEEGDIVNRGDLLLQLDATRFLANVREGQAEYYSLLAKSARLTALLTDQEFISPRLVSENAPEIAVREQRQYEANRNELQQRQRTANERLQQRQQELTEAQARKDQIERSLVLIQREIELTRPLLETGAVSELELINLDRDRSNAEGELAQVNAQLSRIEAAIAEAQSTVAEIAFSARADWQNELADTETRIAALAENLTGLEDRVRLTEVRSPIRGIVQRLYVTTLGGVVQPGREVMELVPLDDVLLIEARIAPQDIAFVRNGQRAVVKLSAYDYSIFGGLEGEVQLISADTITDEQNNTFYLVRIRTEQTQLADGLAILPGMTAQVDIITGKRTVLEYLLKPVLRARDQALRER